jgi:hypothetical protein
MKNTRMTSTKSKNHSAVTRAEVKQMILGITEPKVFSVQSSGTTISAAGTVLNMTNGIVEGDDVANRSGTKITVESMNYRFRFLAVTNDQSARFILVRDLQNLGTTPAVADIIPTSGLLSHYSDVRYHQQHRFSILFDEIVDCSIAGPSVKTIKGTTRRRMPVYYNGATGVATSNGKGSIFLVVIGSLNTGVFDVDIQMVYNDS